MSQCEATLNKEKIKPIALSIVKAECIVSQSVSQLDEILNFKKITQKLVERVCGTFYGLAMLYYDRKLRVIFLAGILHDAKYTVLPYCMIMHVNNHLFTAFSLSRECSYCIICYFLNNDRLGSQHISLTVQYCITSCMCYDVCMCTPELSCI